MTEYSKEYLAALHFTGSCCRCGVAMARTDDKVYAMCGWCAVKEFIADPEFRRYRPSRIVEPAQEWVTANSVGHFVEQFQISKQAAVGLMSRIRNQLIDPYDGQDDSRKSWDLGIAEMRRRHEAAK